MIPDEDRFQSYPRWGDLSPCERIDVIAVPILLPLLIVFVAYLTGTP